MSYRLEFEIDRLPSSVNRSLRTHYFRRTRENNEWDALVRFHCRNKLPPKPLERAHLSFSRYSYRMLDFDGLVGSFKPIADALKDVGVIVDDRWSVTGSWSVTQCFQPKELGSKIRIVVEERCEENQQPISKVETE